MIATVHRNDIGTVLEVTIKDQAGAVVNLTGATLKQIVFHNVLCAGPEPKTAVFTTDGTDGKIQYVTVAGDLHPAALCQVQAHVTIPSGSWHSTVMDLLILENLD